MGWDLYILGMHMAKNIWVNSLIDVLKVGNKVEVLNSMFGFLKCTMTLISDLHTAVFKAFLNWFKSPPKRKY